MGSAFHPKDAAMPRTLVQALAEELVRASNILGDLAYDLGSDGDTLRRHMASLQAIDHVTQMQLAIADLLRAPDEITANAGRVTLEDMAVRLRGALDGTTGADAA
ncbi:hypothetical protein [Sphingomonas ginsenosidimutans]|jgi:hypothetical protein|uniref:Uncharacterized protein n=3 Tax=Sphingomonas TaxID=13687 RepID=A0A2A4I192_9SPHN|nr:hypothetical protein [Sphingomonas ginsenosidimutans]PCG10536.1 hypothetical protein COA17_03765 [Sphingomonas ginsenosidimutans]